MEQPLAAQPCGQSCSPRPVSLPAHSPASLEMLPRLEMLSPGPDEPSGSIHQHHPLCRAGQGWPCSLQPLQSSWGSSSPCGQRAPSLCPLGPALAVPHLLLGEQRAGPSPGSAEQGVRECPALPRAREGSRAPLPHLGGPWGAGPARAPSSAWRRFQPAEHILVQITPMFPGRWAVTSHLILHSCRALPARAARRVPALPCRALGKG